MQVEVCGQHTSEAHQESFGIVPKTFDSIEGAGCGQLIAAMVGQQMLAATDRGSAAIREQAPPLCLCQRLWFVTSVETQFSCRVAAHFSRTTA